MAMPDPPAILVDAVLPLLDARLGQYRKLVVSYTRDDLENGRAPIGHSIDRPLIWATPFRLPKPWTELDTRVAVAKYAVHTALRSEKQRWLIVGQIQRILADHRKLVCGNCPGPIDHGQVLVAWALGRMVDPFWDILSPRSEAYRRWQASR